MTDCTNSFEKFLQIFQDTVQLFASLEKKIIRYNHKTFMTKSLRKAITTRSKLRNRYNKNRTPKNWIIFKKQRKKCVKILRNVKKKYLSNLNVKDVTDSRKIWSTVNPFFSDTSKTVNNIIFSENDKMLKH